MSVTARSSVYDHSPTAAHAARPRFSIVVPAFNESENLLRLLQSIAAAADDAATDILVVDNHSTDETADLAREAGVQVLRPPQKQTIAALRNLGAAATSGEIIVFIDADMEVPADWFDVLTTEFDDPTVDGVGIVEDIPAAAPWFAQIWSRRTLARRSKRRKADFLPGRNIAVRRDVFDRIGGFSDQLRTSEDKDFTMRAKQSGAALYSLVHPGVVHWGYERDFAEWCRKEFWRQRSHLAMLERHGVSLRLLRFPLLSLAHLLGVLFFVAVGGLNVSMTLLVGICLIAPSLALTLAHKESRRSFRDVLAFTGLYFCRFVIAGAAVATEAIDRLRADKPRGKA